MSHYGDKYSSTIVNGKKEQITVVRCVNERGSYLPPMIILNTKRLGHDQTIGEVPETLHGFPQKDGWTWNCSHFGS